MKSTKTTDGLWIKNWCTLFGIYTQYFGLWCALCVDESEPSFQACREKHTAKEKERTEKSQATQTVWTSMLVAFVFVADVRMCLCALVCSIEWCALLDKRSCVYACCLLSRWMFCCRRCYYWPPICASCACDSATLWPYACIVIPLFRCSLYLIFVYMAVCVFMPWCRLSCNSTFCFNIYGRYVRMRGECVSHVKAIFEA